MGMQITFGWPPQQTLIPLRTSTVVTDGLSPLNERRLGHVPSHLPQWASTTNFVLFDSMCVASSVLPITFYVPALLNTYSSFTSALPSDS